MSDRYEAVVFDMDGVLCAYDFEARLAYLERMTGCPAVQVRRAVFESGFEDEADRGELTVEAYMAGIAARLGKPISQEVWLAARAAAMAPNVEVLEMAQTIGRSLPVAVLTNNGALLQASLGDVFPDVLAAFGERIFFSCMLGIAKPEPAVYRLVLDRLGAAPGRALFIDDNADHIAGARRAGLATHHFRDAATLRAALTSAGLL